MEQIIYPLSGGIAIALSSTILLGGIGRILGVSEFWTHSLSWINEKIPGDLFG